MKTVSKAILKNINGHQSLSFVNYSDAPVSEQDILNKLAETICPQGVVMDDSRYQWIQGPIYLVDAVRRCETEHKKFNKDLDQVSDGNVFADIMRGQYIRSLHEVECNGRTNEPGHLQNFDINSFASIQAQRFFRRQKSLCVDEMTVGYEFFTLQPKQKMPIAYMLVRVRDRKVLASQVYASSKKYESVLTAMRLMLSDDGIESRELVANVVGNTVLVYRQDLYDRLREMDVNCQLA